MESSNFKEKIAIVDFNVREKEENDKDIRDEIENIVERFNKKSNDKNYTKNETFHEGFFQ